MARIDRGKRTLGGAIKRLRFKPKEVAAYIDSQRVGRAMPEACAQQVSPHRRPQLVSLRMHKPVCFAQPLNAGWISCAPIAPITLG
jgi:hypothetical protein